MTLIMVKYREWPDEGTLTVKKVAYKLVYIPLNF